ncbi:beta-glucosidase [Lachnospiraceae bacterium ZAX-1]
MGFRNDFKWGVATSSYQVEGAAYEDGKGLSIWDEYSKEGRIYENHNGDIACDHYHRMKEDVRLMAELGVKAYRFSISWPRVIPDGEGAVNQKGLSFYSDLVDELLSYHIVPYVTLFHWDYPQELEMQGGWLNKKSSDWFAYYTKVVVEALGDRVKNFITFNETQIFLWLGYDKCSHAPGIKYPRKRILRMAHNVALAHGKAVLEIRRQWPDSKVGYAPTCGMAYYPAVETKENIEAARKANEDIDPDTWLFSAPFWNELILNGQYHEKCYQYFPEDMPKIGAHDMEVIAQPLDFCGMNIYQGNAVEVGLDGKVQLATKAIGHAKTAMNWPITPECIRWATRFFYEKYHLPLLITENGMSAHDTISLDGKVHDPNRIDYLHRHLLELLKAVEDGVDVLGYFQWSFLDNYEWEQGYNDRFGIVYVEYATQKRIPKDSFFWYQEVITKNGVLL